MPEDTVDRGEGSKQDKQPVMVSVDKNHLGHEIKAPGASFNLSSIFSQDARSLGGDRFSKVYIRTDSGNIYMLNENGQMVNGQASKRRGEIGAATLDKNFLEQAKLTVGEPFSYGEGSNTSAIVEIVPVNERVYDPTYLDTLTGGRSNPIREELISLLPEQKKPAPKTFSSLQQLASLDIGAPEKVTPPVERQEIVQYTDGHTAISLTGDRGAKFEFGKSGNKYDPAASPVNEAIVSTTSGNDYYITHDQKGGTYIVNIGETKRTGKLVAAYSSQYPPQMPSLEYGKPWDIPGFYKTSDVDSFLLNNHKIITGPDVKAGREINEPNPFQGYKELLRKHRPDIDKP